MRTEFLWNVHSYLGEYIRFADAKAAAVTAWSGAIVSALVARNSYNNFLDGKLWTADLMAWLTLGAFIFLVVAFAFAVKVIAPILKYDRNGPTNLIFWEGIRAFRTREEYAKAVNECSDLDERVSNHIYELAGIAQRKFSKTSISIYAAAVGTLLSTFPLFAQ